MGSIWSDGTSIDAVSSNIDRIWNQEVYSTTPDDGEVGSNFNGWRIPVSQFAGNEVNLAERLRENVCIGEFDMSNRLWQKSCGVVDEITRAFLSILKKVSARHYPGLAFGDFVKQGSSREGLKIRCPDEFDMILPFIIEGVDIHAVPARDNNGELIPALVKLQISDHSQIQNVMNGSRYQLLRQSGVFERCGSDLFLNAMCFQMRVISSIMDITISEIQRAIDTESKNQICSFTLRKTSVFPPTYRFKLVIKSKPDFDELAYGQDAFAAIAQSARTDIRYESASSPAWSATHKDIEFDIVPGLLLQTDSVPNPDSWFATTMACHRYAVMKWVHKGRYAVDYPDPNLLWRESSSGYEKHIIDVSSRHESSRYILTACRIMKAYLDGLDHSSQLYSLLSSYHMKNIAIHCILMQLGVSGVKEALGYFMIFLEVCVEMEFLPHYFYGNPQISTMFPNLSTIGKQKRLNLFKNIPHDHFVQAEYSLRRMKADLHSLFTESSRLYNKESISFFRTLCTLYAENNKNSCLLM